MTGDRWEALRVLLEMRRGQLQRKAEENEGFLAHKVAVTTLDFVLDTMQQIEEAEGIE